MAVTGKRWRKLVGEERDKVAAELREMYEDGKSIRHVGILRGFSYGKTRALLEEAGTVFRNRGGRREI